MYLYQKGDNESMRKDAFEFAKEKYFNGYPDTRLVQENFDLNTSFIQDSVDKRIPSKTSRKIRRRNKTHAKAKKTGSKKLRSKLETLKREIKDDVREQHDLYVNNLVGDVKANPRDFYRYINRQTKKIIKVFRPLKEEEELVSQLQKLNGLRNLMVSLRTCSTKMIVMRSHFSVGRPLSWMKLLFQMRV